MLCSFVNYAPGRRTTLRVLRYLIPISAWEVARNPYSRFRVRYAGEKSGLASNCRRGSRLREYRRFTKFVGQRTQRADVSHCAQLTSEAVSTGTPSDAAEPGSGAFELGLDLVLDMPRKVFVRGRGLDSEWAGHLEITGTADDPRIAGQLSHG